LLPRVNLKKDKEKGGGFRLTSGVGWRGKKKKARKGKREKEAAFNAILQGHEEKRWKKGKKSSNSHIEELAQRRGGREKRGEGKRGEPTAKLPLPCHIPGEKKKRN